MKTLATLQTIVLAVIFNHTFAVRPPDSIALKNLQTKTSFQIKEKNVLVMHCENPEKDAICFLVKNPENEIIEQRSYARACNIKLSFDFNNSPEGIYLVCILKNGKTIAKKEIEKREYNHYEIVIK